MLYLFNSGYRVEYKRNLLRGLGAPEGAGYYVNYREGRNLSAAAVAALQQIKVGSEVLLVFINRMGNDDYGFIPVRRGILVGFLTDSGRAEISIQLTSWPSLAEQQDFTAWIRHVGGPRRSQQDQGLADGDYAVVGEDPPAGMFTVTDGWEQTARALAATPAFKASDEQWAIFARLDLLDAAKPGKLIKWSGAIASAMEERWRKIRGRPLRSIRFQGGRTYAARITYFFPAQQIDASAEAPYDLRLDGGLKAVSGLSDFVSAEHRAKTFEFYAPPLQSGTCRIDLAFADGNPKILAPRLEIVGEYALSPPLVLVGLLIGVVWVIGSGLAAQMASDKPDVVRAGYYISAIFQYVAMLLMFRFLGSKP